MAGLLARMKGIRLKENSLNPNRLPSLWDLLSKIEEERTIKGSNSCN